jgi:hypothetical protein
MAVCGSLVPPSNLHPPLGQEFIIGVDSDARWTQGCHMFAKYVTWNRDSFERMQDHLNLLDLERGIESRIACLPDNGLAHHMYNHPSTANVI